MADELDRASEYEDMARDAAVSMVRNAAQIRLPATGQCYYCEAHVVGDERFCDSDCRDDYELEKKMNSISGKR